MSEEEWVRVATLLDAEATRTYLGWIKTEAVAKAVQALNKGLDSLGSDNAQWVPLELGRLLRKSKILNWASHCFLFGLLRYFLPI